MNRCQGLIAAILLAFTPLLTHANDAKCQRPQVSNGHPQSSCGSAAKSGDFDTGSRDGLFHFSATRNALTPACRDATDDVMMACARKAQLTKRNCFQTRLSATCQAQTGLPLREQRDPTCERQIESCEGASSSDIPACWEQELPTGCVEQIRAANRARESKSACVSAQQREADAIRNCHDGGRNQQQINLCVAQVRPTVCP